MGHGAPVTQRTHLFPSPAHTLSGKTEDEQSRETLFHLITNLANVSGHHQIKLTTAQACWLTSCPGEGREAIVSCGHNQAWCQFIQEINQVCIFAAFSGWGRPQCGAGTGHRALSSAPITRIFAAQLLRTVFTPAEATGELPAADSALGCHNQ